MYVYFTALSSGFVHINSLRERSEGVKAVFYLHTHTPPHLLSQEAAGVVMTWLLKASDEVLTITPASHLLANP